MCVCMYVCLVRLADLDNVLVVAGSVPMLSHPQSRLKQPNPTTGAATPEDETLTVQSHSTFVLAFQLSIGCRTYESLVFVFWRSALVCCFLGFLAPL